MATAVEMPKLGNTVEDCLLATWRKQTGDEVRAGDLIAEIETDKTNFELTAPVDGVLLETFFEEGSLVPVFTPICAIGARGESTEALRPRATAPPPNPLQGGRASSDRDGRAPPAFLPVSPPGEGRGDAGSPRPSPRARRFARDHDFKPSVVEGTGPGGRLLEDDLRRAWHSTVKGQSPLTEQAEPRPASRTRRVRPTTAPRFARSRRTWRGYVGGARDDRPAGEGVARLYGAVHPACLGQRDGAAARAQTDEGLGLRAPDININDLVTFLTVRALLEVPELNATFVDRLLYRHGDVNIGFACDTDRGLVVPVVRATQDLSLLGLARRMKELTGQALAGTIAPNDLTGGTFTVTNLGAFGVESFTPVLNPPQVAILGVGAIGVKPARKPDGNLEFVDTIGLSLTLDHQVIDGAPGARFLGVLRGKFEAAEQLCTT